MLAYVLLIWISIIGNDEELRQKKIIFPLVMPKSWDCETTHHSQFRICSIQTRQICIWFECKIRLIAIATILHSDILKFDGNIIQYDCKVGIGIIWYVMDVTLSRLFKFRPWYLKSWIFFWYIGKFYCSILLKDFGMIFQGSYRGTVTW